MAVNVPQIDTDRLRLRAFRNEDHAAYAAFLADEQATRFIGGVRDADAAWRIMAAFCGHWQLRGYGPFAIEETATGTFVGYTGLWFPHGKPEREIMWGIVPSAQRNGYASEAAKAARDYAYEQLGWSVAVSYIADDNAASQGVAGKLGAVRDGRVDHQGWQLDVWRHPAATASRPGQAA
ncbi:MAG: GNAT family N-acetyltransferase [Hyphomicrobiaceae bacterium]